MAGITENPGLIAVKNNAQLDAEAEAQRQAQQEAEGEGNKPVVDALAAHFRRQWTKNRDAKQPIEREMLKSLAQREGKYDDQKLAAIRAMGGSEIKMMLTDVKCRAAESILHDVLFGSGERPFSCEATPLPEMPQELREVIQREAYEELRMVTGLIPSPRELRERIEAYEEVVRRRAKMEMDKRATRMEERIDDEYIQGGWYDAMPKVLYNFITLKAGILWGPEINVRPKLTWAPGKDPVKPNAVVPVVERKPTRVWQSLSPFDVYPSPSARSFQEGTLIIRRRMEPSALYDMVGVPGFDGEKLRLAIQMYGATGHSDWLWHDQQRATLEGRPYEEIYGKSSLIDVLSCHGKVQGAWLTEWGMEGIDDPEKWYEANCWLIGNLVVRAVLNDDPLGMRPIHADSFIRVEGSPWGRGVPEVMTDLQDMCDSAARAIANNMGIASGPMVEIEVDRLPDGEKVTNLYPWKIFQTTQRKGQGANSPAVRFFQANSHADVLIGVFEFFSKLADEHTGIPRYQTGDSDMGGAAKTASGLSMLMNASSRLFKMVIRNVDNIIISCTKRTHRDVMMFDDEMPEKGDVEVVAKASQALLHRETQQMRVNEVLASTNNPIDFGIMGPRGRLELLRSSLRSLDSVDVDKVLPTDDQMLLSAMAGPVGQQPPPEEGSDEERPDEPLDGAAA